MSTSASVFTARIGLGGHLFGLHGTRVQGFTGAILICNQGVRGSSPLCGTAKINHLRATIRNFRIVHMPIKSAARTRCTSVPRDFSMVNWGGRAARQFTGTALDKHEPRGTRGSNRWIRPT